jgi:hypothetical protein
MKVSGSTLTKKEKQNRDVGLAGGPANRWLLY